MKLKRRLTSMAITKLEEAWKEFCFDAETSGYIPEDVDDEYNYLFRHFRAGVKSGLRDLGKHEGEEIEEYED